MEQIENRISWTEDKVEDQSDKDKLKYEWNMQDF
jgi:hypothetical protein